MKNEYLLRHNRLKVCCIDAINAVLAATAMYFQELLRACRDELAAEIQHILD